MGIEVFGAIIVGLLSIIPLILNARKARKANRNDIGKVESAELGAAMDRADAAPRVRPAPQQGKSVYVRRKPPV